MNVGLGIDEQSIIVDNLSGYAIVSRNVNLNFGISFKNSIITILDKNNTVIANIKASNKAVLIGSKLYDKQGKAMIIIDLKESIEQ